MRLLITSLQKLQYQGISKLRSSLSSLRLCLILLVLIAVVPTFGLALYTNVESRQLETAQVQEEALRLTRLAANTQGQLIERTQQLLFVLAQLQRVQRSDSPKACSTLMADLLQQYSLYTNLGVAELNGKVRCSAFPLTESLNQANRSWFQRTVQTQKFSAGDDQITQISGKASIHFGYPVRDQTGQLKGIVYAALDLAALNQLATTVQLPPGSTFIVLDHQGTILARSPDPETWIGRSAPEASIVNAILNHQKEGTLKTRGLDGIERLYAFTPLSGAPEGSNIYVSIGIPKTLAYAEADQILFRNLTGLGLIALLATVAAWLGCDLFILSQVKGLLKATKQLTTGDLSSRTGLAHGSGELSQLARAFDTMAASLEQSLKRQESVLATLWKREKKYRSVLNSIREVIFQTDETGYWTFLNPAWTEITGFEIGESLGTHLLDYVHPDDRQAILDFELWAASSDTNRKFKTQNLRSWCRHQGRYLTKDGTYCWMELQAQFTFGDDGTLIGTSGTLNDITERKAAEEALQKAHEQLELRVAERTADLAKVNADLHKQFAVSEAARQALQLTEKQLQETTSLQRAILDSANYAIISTTPDGIIRTFNAAAEALLGYTASEVVDKVTPLLFHAPDEILRRGQELSAEFMASNNPEFAIGNEKLSVSGFEVLVAKARRGEPDEREWTCIRKDGSRFPIQLSVTALHNPEGDITGFLGIGSNITARKAAEATLRKYADDLRDLYNQAPCGYHSLGKDGTYIFINETELNWLGYTREEIIGKKKFSDLLTAESLEVFKVSFPQLQKRGWVRDLEFQMVRKDGTILPVMLNATAIKDASGTYVMSRSSIFDITERKAAEEKIRILNAELEQRVIERTQELEAANALKDELLVREQAARESAEISEQRYRFLLEAIPQLVWTIQPDGCCDYVSQRWIDYTGLTLEQSQGVGWTAALHPEDVPLSFKAWNQALQTGEDFIIEYRLRAQDGQYRWHLAHILPMRDATGQIIKWLGTCTDMDDQKRAEEQLRQSEERYRSLVVATSQMVWTTNADGQIVSPPSVWSAYTGQSQQEIQGVGWLDALHPQDVNRTLEIWQSALQTKSLYDTEFRLRATDGSYRYFSVRGVPILAANGDVREWVGTCSDITERKQAEREIRLLLTMTQAISEAPDFHTALEVALQKVCETTAWNFAEAWIPRTDKAALELSPAWYACTPDLEKFRQQSVGLILEPNVGLPGRVWESQQPEWVQDISSHPETVFCRTQIALENGIKSGVAVPIVTDNQVLAVLVFFSFESGAKNKRLVELVSAVAMQLGSVIQRKQMEEALDKLLVQLQRETEDLWALTTVTANAISTLNLEELLEVLLRRILQVTHADTAVIILIEDNHLRVAKSIGRNEAALSNCVFGLGEGFAGTIASTMQPLYIEDAQTDPRVLPFRKELGTRTMLGVPLKRHGNLIGVLHVDWFSIHPKSEREIHLLEITAERCAMAILNAQLYEELRKREELYCTLTKNFPNGYVLLFDHDLRYALAEGSGLAQLGLSKDMIEGKTIWEVLPPEICQEIEPRYRDALAGVASTFEILYAERVYLLHMLPVRNEPGEIFAGMVMAQDITERKRAEEQMRYYAFHDSLTELPNRAWFLEKLSQLLEEVEQDPERLFAVLFLDLDRFQIVKYSLGHLVADQMLIATARKLKQCLRPTDIVARVGSDEFAILLPEIQHVNDAIRVSERIHQQLTSPFDLDGHEVFSTTSIGIALSSIEDRRPENFLRAADTALHHAKKIGKARHAVFVPAMRLGAVARLQMETDLRRALKRHELQPYYQPIVSLQSGKIKGFEALVRWKHPTRGLVSPADFIPLAEETGLIIPLGAWVLREACHQMRIWQLAFPEFTTDLTMSVNLSGVQFGQPNLIEQIDQILEETGIAPCCLKLEITESVIMDNAESAKAVLEELKARNILLCIDDFGTGYSSLSYLHRWPIDTLKIDRSFVRDIGIEAHSREIIWTIVTLASNLGMEVVAEGVETSQHLTQLRALKRECHYAQGYFFSKPVESETAIKLLTSDLRW